MRYFVFIILGGIIFFSGCQGTMDRTSSAVVDPVFDGIGGLTYDAVSQELVFDGYKDGYFLDIEGQIKNELIFFDDPGRYKLEYPGYYTVTLLNDRDPVGIPLKFHKSQNDAAKYTITTNLIEHGLDSPLYGSLNDGWSGVDNPNDGQWWCWKNQDAAIVIAVGDENAFVKNIKFRYYEDVDNQIFPPSSIAISGSEDGVNYTKFFVKAFFTPSNIYYSNVEAVVNNNFKFYRIDLFAHSTDQSENAAPSYLLIDEIFMTEGTPTFQKVNVQEQ